MLVYWNWQKLPIFILQTQGPWINLREKSLSS